MCKRISKIRSNVTNTCNITRAMICLENSRAEVIEALKMMKVGKALGHDSILLKCEDALEM